MTMNQDHSEKDIIIGIDCNVENCKYNDGRNNCFADTIHVGPTHAQNRQDTVCDTFKTEQ